MKIVIFVLTFALLTVGCRQDSTTSNRPNTNTSMPQNETLSVPPNSPNSGNGSSPTVANNSQGGGVDSSGGDMLQSTESDVELALEKFEEKVYNVAFRLGYELIGAEKTNFETKFGPNSYNLTRDLINAKNRLGQTPLDVLRNKTIQFKYTADSCEADQQLKAGSARWISDKIAEICISKSELRKMSPASLQLDVIALALHEISHLFDYDETKAQAIQSFVLTNKGLLWPHPDQIRDILDNADDLIMLFTDLLLSLRDKNHSKICSTADMMKMDLGKIYKNIFDSKSIILPSPVMVTLRFIPPTMSDIDEACEKGKASKIQKSVANGALVLFDQIVNANNAIRHFANPSKPGSVYNTFAYLDVMSLFEDGAIVKSVNPKADTKSRIEMEDVVCSITTYDVSQPQNKNMNSILVTGSQFYGDKTKGVGNMNHSLNEDIRFMLRRLEGQRGVGIGFMSENFKVTSSLHMFPTNGGSEIKHPIFATSLIPGINDNFQFDANDGTLGLKVRCGYKINGKVPDLTYQEPKKPAQNQKDQNDEHFISAPKTQVNLRIRLNKEGQEYVVGGPDLGGQPIKTIRYNGHIILTSENEECIVPGQELEKRKINRTQLAQDIRDGKYREIICDMNGTQKGGQVSHAPWAFKWEFK